MFIKSNYTDKQKQRARDNFKAAMKGSAMVIGLGMFAYTTYYLKHHGNDDLMEKIKLEKYQLFDESFAGSQNQKVYDYKVVTVDGIYKVEIFNQNGTHSHYANPSNISIIEN